MQAKKDLIISILILSICTFLFYISTTFKQPGFGQKLGPGSWPQAILCLIILLALAMLIQNVVLLKKESLRLPKDSEPEIKSKGYTGSLLAAVAVSLAYGFSVDKIGFLLAVFLFQICFLLILRVKNMLILILYPLALTSVIYLIFIELLYIPLPRGSGIFLQLSRWFY